MSRTRPDTDSENDALSVKELEAKLKSRPGDAELKIELADALLNCHIYGGNGYKKGDMACFNHLRDVVGDLPEGWASYFRAYLAFVDGREEACVKELTKFSSTTSQQEDVPFDCDELIDYFIIPFGLAEKKWIGIAEALSQGWPDSAAALTLHGLARLGDAESLGDAIDYLVRAIDKDESYWLAAWWCASAYSQEENWRAARNYYQKALESEAAQEVADIHFDFAWCSGKLKDYQEEEKHYRACLELMPDYRYARNNLGWSLYKQAEYGEALEVFEEAIRRGNDGKYPLRNKVRTLEKLDRLSEAVEMLQQDTYRGELTRSTQREIDRLQATIADQEQSRVLLEHNIGDLEEEEEEAVAVDGRVEELSAESSDVPLIESTRTVKPVTAPSAVPSERWLEKMLEEQIQKDSEAFGRRLRIYDRLDSYGRQFAIPGVGRIDLLAEDIETKDLVVIELKQGTSDDQVIGQISRYMTWVRENLAHSGQGVLGIICVYRASRNLKLSASNVPELDIFEYGLTLQRVD